MDSTSSKKNGVYAWGSSSHGELGLGEISENYILEPRPMPPWSGDKQVVQIACGVEHTLFLLANGKIYSCGNNSHGQLGHDLPVKRPQFIKDLDHHFITKVGCGESHSLALNEWGQIFVWGKNNRGQLGLPDTQVEKTPKILKKLLTKTIIQIACGRNHNLALTNSGEVYAWGDCSRGQLGLGGEVAIANEPTFVDSLYGVPVAFIACGGTHSFVLSKSGAVYGFGGNNMGQLGQKNTTTYYYPTQLKHMRSFGVRYIVCGDDFSVFLAHDGGVFTCGCGTHGQLGHGSNNNEHMPRKVQEFMGSTIIQVACGLRHTLALAAPRGRIFAFGLSGSGQLGVGVRNINSSTPQEVHGPWTTNEKHNKSAVPAVAVKQIFAGGNHCLAITAEIKQTAAASVDLRIYDTKFQILNMTVERAKQISQVAEDETIDLDLLTYIELVFTSLPCMNGSFLKENDMYQACNSHYHGVDMDAAKQAFDYIAKIQNDTIKTLIFDEITGSLLSALTPSPADVEILRIYLMLPLYQEFVNANKNEKLHVPFAQAVLKLQLPPSEIIQHWWSKCSVDYFERLVTNYKNVVAHIITFKIRPNPGDVTLKRFVGHNPNLIAALEMLVTLYQINMRRAEKVPDDAFCWAELAEVVDIQQDYIHWLFNKDPDAFNICNYPFLFNVTAKTTLLQADQAMQMHSAIVNSATHFPLFESHPTGPHYIMLKVSRDKLVEDTLREIMKYNESDLKKPLKIKFHDEEAEDAGGVRKEFFMLLLKDIIDPKYGMFKEIDESRMYWFESNSFETEDMYCLIGIICGLAIYNFTIINLPFPLALYKKLLSDPVTLSDLEDLMPTVAHSMKSILEYEDADFVEVFDLRFTLDHEVFGERHTVLLKENGDEISVTQETKKEFVDLYIDYIFNKSVENQFKAFRKGFMKVCWGRILQIFKPHELMAVVVGNEEYDWVEFEQTCQYKGDYSASSQQIKWFWEVFHELPESEKRKFLLFLTGSDRIPVHGMRTIKLCIQPTSDERYLPVAHTCFNLLDLPYYNTKERLKYKLQQAIQQTQGFSLV